MKTIGLLLLLLLASAGFSQEVESKKDVLANGGGSSSTSILRSNGTLGQLTAGKSSSSGFMIRSGFWAGEVIGVPCGYVVGDVNGSTNYNGLDITYGVAFFKGGNPPQCGQCDPCSGWHFCGDVNGSCDYNGLDITYGVNYFKGGTGPTPCGDCPPN